MEEIWKPVEELPNKYLISNYGRVKYIGGYRGKEPTITLGNKDKKGYYGINMWDGNNKKYISRKIHYLVARAFVDNPNNYLVINHKDENPSNNLASNLEWCTYKYNNEYGTARERATKTRIKKGISKRTIRFEKINRPFEIIGQVATTRASKEYWNARRIGINKYNIFLPHVFSNGEWSFGDSNIDEAIELYKKYNIFMYNIRFEVRTDDLSDNRILEYSNMVKDKIDKLMANNIPVENIFLSNETPNVYNNHKWTSALIELSDWVRKKGYKSGISHYTGMPSSIESYGAPQEYNSANFDKYGINLYPSLSPKGNNDLGYKPKQSDIIKAHNKFRTQFDYLVDRGYTSMTITETGFSEYNNGMYSVDDRTLPMDTTGYIYITAWKEWLNILSHYASMIDSMDVWVSPEIDRTSEAMYNILLNFQL